MSAASEVAATKAEATNKSLFGFWVYIMTDCVLFASLFATYAVLQSNTNGGPPGARLFSLPYVLIETVILLTSSFTCGLAVLALNSRNRQRVLAWFSVTFVLGLSFLIMELSEFSKLAHDGNSWHRSGFLSSFFTLVGTHGLHITIGLIWMSVLMFRVLRSGLKEGTVRHLAYLSLFWHFLDVIWIFIFTIVYLRGAIYP